MKKIALLSILALGFAFVSCDDYKEPNPPAQFNPQESVLKTDEVNVAAAISPESLYDLAELNNSGSAIRVAQISCPTLPEGYAFGAVVEISKNEFETSVQVPSVTEAEVDETTGAVTYNVTVTPDDLQGVYFDNFSHSPSAATIEVRVSVLTEKGKEVAYVGGPDNYYGPYTMHITPFPSTAVIEDAYYLLGTINGWSVATAVKFNHSDASPYDDPVFSLTVDITPDQAAEGWWWKVVPQSTYANGDWVGGANTQFGVAENGDGAMQGMLVASTADSEPGAGCIKQSGPFTMTINLLEGTYEFTSAVPFLYTPGDANGWNQGASQMLFTSDYENYYGYAVLSPNGFKFTNAPDWDHTNYGDSGSEGVLSNDGGAGNLSVPEYGLYWCHVNTVSLTYDVTYIETIGVIGDATAEGWDASTPLTPSADFLTWTGNIVFKGGEFKFRANNGWDINLGGTMQDLQQGGDNLPSPGEGTYTVTLNLGQLPYSAQATK